MLFNDHSATQCNCAQYTKLDQAVLEAKNCGHYFYLPHA